MGFLVTIMGSLWPFLWDASISIVYRLNNQIKLILVIVLTMIGPEARKVDHVKEEVERDEHENKDIKFDSTTEPICEA